MAVSKNNEVMQGASGRIGRNLVFRQRGGLTTISNLQRKRDPSKPFTSGQIAARLKFAEATSYAHEVMADLSLKERYRRKAVGNQSAFNVAMKDYIRAPELRLLDDTNYRGQVGAKIQVLVSDVLELQKLTVEILDASGNVLEMGAAQADNTYTEWIYVVSLPNPDYKRSSYRITMIDTPGKVTLVEKDYADDQ